MAEQPTEDERRAWHRRFAVDTNNRAWALLEQADLTDADREELMRTAYASAHHWAQVGAEHQHALAALLLAFAHARLGQTDLAWKNASTTFAYFEGRESEPWERAFAAAAMAAAAAALGDHDSHARYHARASDIAHTLDDEDRSIFMATFRRVQVP